MIRFHFLPSRCLLALTPVLGTLLLFGCSQEPSKNSGDLPGQPRNVYTAMTDGPVYQKLTHIEKLFRQFDQTDEGDPIQARAALKNSTQAIIDTARSVLATKPIDDFDQKRAAKAMFDAYLKLMGADPAKYKEFLLACDELIAGSPGTESASQASFMKVNVIGTTPTAKLDDSDPLKDPKKRLYLLFDAALEMANQTPPHANAAGVLYNLARQLEHEKDFEHSAQVFGLLADKFPDPEKRPFLPGHFRRVSMVGKPVCEIRGKDFEGKELSIEQFKGKVVLVDFWATWCPPCVAELDGIKKLYQDLGPRGLEILGLNADDDQPKAAKYIKDKKLTWPEIPIRTAEPPENPEDALEFQLGVEFLPTKLLINREGIVVWTGSSLEEVKPEIEKLLPADSPQTAVTP